MRSGLIYLEQSKVMGNKVGKVDHSHQPLAEYKCQTVEFNWFFKKISMNISSISIIYHLSINKELHDQGHI